MNHGGARRRPSFLLLPMDFQEPSRRALLLGIKLATVLGTQVTLLYVIKIPTDLSDKSPDSRSLRSLRTSALLELVRLTRTAQEHGVSAQPLLGSGDPIGCILETVVRGHTDLIVMGTEGRTGWDRLWIDGTAEGVVCQAPCPVLTVHGGLAGDIFCHPGQGRLRRILLGTDFSRDAAAALQVVHSLALKLHATVRIVHGSQASAGNGRVDRTIAKQARHLRSLDIKADGVCVPGDPVETILTQVAVYQADLLAVGTSERGGLSPAHSRQRGGGADQTSWVSRADSSKCGRS